MSGPSASANDLATSLGALQQGEVHLWWGRADGVESLDASWGSLSDEERRRGERFLRQRDARLFRFRRAFLRAVLARYAGCGPEALAFVAGPFGKPALAPPHAELAFNGTSRGGFVLVGVAFARAIGVDLEPHPSPLVSDPEEIARLARHVATRSERARLLARPVAERPRAFLELWTRKEALLKALGTGLSREPGTVEVGWGAEAVDPGGFGQGFEPRWLEVEPPEGIVASAVVAVRPGETVCARRATLGRGPGPAGREVGSFL